MSPPDWWLTRYVQTAPERERQIECEHPERKKVARGACMPCYLRHYRRTHQEG